MAGHVGRHETVHHAANTDDSTREDTGVDGCFGVVTHETSQKLDVGGDFGRPILDVDFSIGILQITVARPRTQIDPAAQIAVTQKTMMLFVGVRFDDRGLDFATN